MLPLLLLPTALLAQGPRCPSAGDTAALTLAEVERRPVADSTNAPPPYPDLLRQAGIGGPVRVTFTVDTAGRVERATIRVVRTPNAGFDFAVKRAVASWLHKPASLCGRAVRARLSHEFVFLPTPRPTPKDTLWLAVLFGVDTAVTPTADTLPDGTPRTSLGWRASPVVVAPVPWDSAALDSAEEAAIDELVVDISPASTGLARVVCLPSGRRTATDPDLQRLIRLTRPGIAVLPERRCPPTFDSMIYKPEQRPYPPGEDPFHVRVLKRAPISATRVVFNADVWQGTSGKRYRCGVERLGGGWRAHCLVVSYWVS
jgi:TonB family protein